MPNGTIYCQRIKHINVTRLLLFLALALVLVSCSRTVFIVRHAEKISSTDSAAKMMANDPPLSEAGKVRAFVLRDQLKTKHIKHIYSTNTVRARATAEPLSEATKINIELYNNVDSLVNVIQSMKGNILVVGHSNTVDDIVNKLCRQTKIAADLNDKEYDNLFVVKIRGKKRSFSMHKYGYASNP